MRGSPTAATTHHGFYVTAVTTPEVARANKLEAAVVHLVAQSNNLIEVLMVSRPTVAALNTGARRSTVV